MKNLISLIKKWKKAIILILVWLLLCIAVSLLFPSCSSSRSGYSDCPTNNRKYLYKEMGTKPFKQSKKSPYYIRNKNRM